MFFFRKNEKIVRKNFFIIKDIIFKEFLFIKFDFLNIFRRKKNSINFALNLINQFTKISTLHPFNSSCEFFQEEQHKKFLKKH